jgi:hypothetical protein
MIGLPSMQTLQGHGKGRKLTKVVSKCDSVSSSMASSLNEILPEIFCVIAPAYTSFLPSTTNKRGVCVAPWSHLKVNSTNSDCASETSLKW